MPEPRYHLRESQDLSAYEWEEMAGEFTHCASHFYNNSPVLNNKACFLCMELICFHDFESDHLKSIWWEVFRCLSLSVSFPPSVKTGPDLAPGLLGQLLG